MEKYTYEEVSNALCAVKSYQTSKNFPIDKKKTAEVLRWYRYNLEDLEGISKEKKKGLEILTLRIALESLFE